MNLRSPAITQLLRKQRYGPRIWRLRSPEFRHRIGVLQRTGGVHQGHATGQRQRPMASVDSRFDRFL
jgi:hypothetical protein